jgi:hypothetical protein
MRSLAVEKTPWVKIQRMSSHLLEEVLITLQLQNSKLGPELYILVKKEMKCVYVMLLQSMEMGREVLLSQHI